MRVKKKHGERLNSVKLKVDEVKISNDASFSCTVKCEYMSPAQLNTGLFYSKWHVISAPIVGRSVSW